MPHNGIAIFSFAIMSNYDNLLAWLSFLVHIHDRTRFTFATLSRRLGGQAFVLVIPDSFVNTQGFAHFL